MYLTMRVWMLQRVVVFGREFTLNIFSPGGGCKIVNPVTRSSMCFFFSRVLVPRVNRDLVLQKIFGCYFYRYARCNLHSYKKISPAN